MYCSPLPRISRRRSSAIGALPLQMVLDRRGTLVEELGQLPDGELSAGVRSDRPDEVSARLPGQMTREPALHLVDERGGEIDIGREVSPDGRPRQALQVRTTDCLERAGESFQEVDGEVVAEPPRRAADDGCPL